MNHSNVVANPPPIEVPIVHPDVDRASIRRLVQQFYARILSDERLGPIFASEIQGDWEPHLEKMTNFWCSVMLKDGSYQGRPVPAHLKLKQVREDDFAVWLGHFGATAAELFPEAVAAAFITRAERIARSLHLAMFFRLDGAKTGEQER